MEIGFKRFDKDWVLPVDGTPGTKSRNLFVHNDAAIAAGFKRAEAVVVPWEYLKAVQNPTHFVLSTIDEWLPGWQRVYVRSDAPDEDSDRRIPGLYQTETILHKDRGYAEVSINQVIQSYDTVWARRSRRMRGVPETGMGILLERAIGATPADCAGAYTQGAGWAKILFADPKKGHEAMISPYLEACVVINGRIERAHMLPEEKHANLKEGVTYDELMRRGKTFTEERVARKLYDLVMRLPQQEGKGWEIEFLAYLSGSYVAQITPIVNHQPITVPDLESLFEATEVVGTGDYTLNGILALPLSGARAVEDFDKAHPNYTVLAPFGAVSGRGGRLARTLLSLLNARTFLLIKTRFEGHDTLASHVEQYLRNTGLALAVSSPTFEIGGPPLSSGYSPTPHRIVADEASGKGVILLNEPLRPFEPI